MILMKTVYVLGAHQSVDAATDWEVESASWHWQRPLSTARGWLCAYVVNNI